MDPFQSSNLMLNESIYPEEPLAFQVLSFDNPRTHYIFLVSDWLLSVLIFLFILFISHVYP